MPAPAIGRSAAFLLLATSCLLWAGNWVAGRALRDAYDPLTLNFARWAIAVVVLAPFAWTGLAGKGALVRRNLGMLLLLAFTGVSLFQSLIYLGLRTTTAVNGVLINSSLPLFMILCSWAIEREKTTPRQVLGMLVSAAGILVIVSRGELANLLHLEVRPGDGWILLAMPVWGIYSVLLKRRPPELGGTPFLFVLAVLGLLLLLPVAAVQWALSPPRAPSVPEAAGVLYMGIAASVIAFACWNKGVAIVGANAAGFTLHLLPAFGTVLAILFLGESFGLHHAAGVAIVLAGVVLATRR